MPRSRKGGKGYRWHVAANNPTDQPVTATFKTGMKLPGLVLRTQTRTVPAGAYVVLQK
jgi:hypothetical protein